MRSILLFVAYGLLILAAAGCRQRDAPPAEGGFVKATDWPPAHPLPISAFQLASTQDKSDIALKITNKSGFDFTDYNVDVSYARVIAGIEDMASKNATGKSWKRGEAVEIRLAGKGSPISKKIRLTVTAADEAHAHGGIPGKGGGYRDGKVNRFSKWFYQYQEHQTIP
jgi:hypothetical protein